MKGTYSGGGVGRTNLDKGRKEEGLGVGYVSATALLMEYLGLSKRLLVSELVWS